MNTLDFDRVLDALSECAHGLLDSNPSSRLNAYTSLELLTRKLEDRLDEFPRAAASEQFWRIRSHADAILGFTRGDGAPVEWHLEQIRDAIDELHGASVAACPNAEASRHSVPRLCLAS